MIKESVKLVSDLLARNPTVVESISVVPISVIPSSALPPPNQKLQKL